MRNALPRTALASLLAIATLGCVSFGRDEKAIDDVQSSWGPAEQLMSRGDYAKAVKELQAGVQFLPSIHDKFIRGCVAEGADIRIVSARAGETYLAKHPGDVAGAKAAASRAWSAYPQRHDCP